MKLHQLLAIAKYYRPNVDFDEVKSPKLGELIDLLRCAVLKKKEEEDEIVKYFHNLNGE